MKSLSYLQSPVISAKAVPILRESPAVILTGCIPVWKAMGVVASNLAEKREYGISAGRKYCTLVFSGFVPEETSAGQKLKQVSIHK